MELELRRRLWYCIALLDTHGSYDRGAPPIIRSNDLGPAPRVLNDEELSRGIMSTSSSPRLNEMSFFALMFRAMVCQKQMISIPESGQGTWAARLQMVASFEKSINQDYFNVREDAHPFERYTEQVAKGIVTSMHLLLRRPPYRQHSGLVPSSDDYNVLEHSTEVLQQDLATKSIDFAPWAWKTWVRWNALAVVLVELCSKPPGDSYNAAYSVAVQSFNHYSALIADTETGMLWKPITKLMLRAQQLGLSDSIEQNLSVDKLSVDAPTLSRSSILIPDGYETDYNSYDQTTEANSDAQIDWFTFTDSFNMDCSFDGGF
jgi:hypothetical protein